MSAEDKQRLAALEAELAVERAKTRALTQLLAAVRDDDSYDLGRTTVMLSICASALQAHGRDDIALRAIDLLDDITRRMTQVARHG